MIIIVMFCISGWLNSVGSLIMCELDNRKSVLSALPTKNITGNFLSSQWVALSLFNTTCTTSFLAQPATTGKVPANFENCQMCSVNMWANGRFRDMS